VILSHDFLRTTSLGSRDLAKLQVHREVRPRLKEVYVGELSRVFPRAEPVRERNAQVPELPNAKTKIQAVALELPALFDCSTDPTLFVHVLVSENPAGEILPTGTDPLHEMVEPSTGRWGVEQHPVARVDVEINCADDQGPAHLLLPRRALLKESSPFSGAT